jgi:hypothetical protein
VGASQVRVNEPDLGHDGKPLRAALALITLLVAGMLAGAAPASAASSCPPQTFLSFDHLAYEATVNPATVSVPGGSSLGSGTIDEPTNANGCRRVQRSVAIQAAGSIQPEVAVLVRGRPRTLFVIGHRCDGFTGSAHWDCLLRPLVFRGRQFTATSYPGATPRKVPLGAAIGTAKYHGRTVTVRRLQGVSDSLALGISGQPSTAFLSPRTCPYSGFATNPQYDNLLRCLRAPVWFSFDPPGNQAGTTVVGRSDRPLAAAVAGAPVSLVSLPVVADFVPPHHGPLVPVGRVADKVSVRIPNVPAGLYEAVVSCPKCSPGAGVGSLYPAGSILVTAKPKSSPGIRVISYVLAALVVVAAIMAVRTYRRRRGTTGTGGRGWGRSSRR